MYFIYFAKYRKFILILYMAIKSIYYIVLKRFESF
jgi:hypothetical protein